jgi:hypothetical protein
VPAHERRPLGPSRPREAAPTETAPTPASATSGVLRTLLSLGLVLGLLVGGGVLLKHLARRSGGLGAMIGAGGRAPSGVLEVLGRFPVQRGLTLVLLKLDRRVLLVSQSSSRRAGVTMTPLCELTDPEEVASILAKTRDDEGDSMARRFEALLRDEDSRAGGAGSPDGAPNDAEAARQRGTIIDLTQPNARAGRGGERSAPRVPERPGVQPLATRRPPTPPAPPARHGPGTGGHGAGAMGAAAHASARATSLSPADLAVEAIRARVERLRASGSGEVVA